MSFFIKLVRYQLQQGLLMAKLPPPDLMPWQIKYYPILYMLPLPYSRTENTRMKFFPYHKTGDHTAYVRYFDNKKKEHYYQRISSYEYNNELLNDLRKAMSKIGHDLGSRQIDYIGCQNCNDSNQAVKVTIYLTKPAEPVTEPVAVLVPCVILEVIIILLF